MPSYLKFVYLGGAALAVTAVVLGMYEFLASTETASFLADVVLPFGVLAIIVALYLRRKGEMEKGDE